MQPASGKTPPVLQRDPVDAGRELEVLAHRRMKETYRRRMAKLGPWPNMVALHLVVLQPGAIERLRGAA